MIESGKTLEIIILSNIIIIIFIVIADQLIAYCVFCLSAAPAKRLAVEGAKLMFEKVISCLL